ncbi:MAG: flagellar filament capping protein FliD [Clostridiales bacterium]|nr:flagellar filament capping protein FliD [Clostridiales bacterium]MDY4112973.1 flagellar filament capping protein FliD [Roseburia sp.]
MPIRITGLNSGLDTETIISALVSSYSYKTDKYKKAQTKLSWKQDAWKSLNTKIYSLYNSVGNLRFSSAYNLKSTKVSDSTKATVTASSSAPNGTQKLNIISVAQAGYLTGGKLDDSTTTGTTLAELGYTAGDGTINVTMGDGTKKAITVTQGTTVSSFINSLKDAGLSASYDSVNKRIFVSSKETGKDNDFTLTGADAAGSAALTAMGLSVDSDATKATYASYTKYYGDGSNIKGTVEQAVADYTAAKEAYEKASAQNANMTAAYGYASAYSAMMDALQNTGLSQADQEKMKELLAMTATQRVNTVMDADGNIYTQKGTDADGNAIFSYTDAEGNERLIQRVVTKSDDTGESVTTYYEATSAEVGTGFYKYTTEDGTFTQNDDGTYTGSDKKTYKLIDGNMTEVDADGNAVSGGKVVAVTDDQKVEITKTEYTQGAVAGDVKRSADVLTELKENSGLTDKEISTLTTNIKNVNAYENTKDTVLDDADQYSRASIVSRVHNAYGQNGADAVTAEVNTYAAVITANKNTMEAEQATMEEHSVLADIAAIEDSTEQDAAIDAFVEEVESAKTLETTTTYNTDAKKIDGTDSKIMLNGIEYESSLNTYSINGLNITVQAVTGEGDDNAITITTATDTQGIYDKIKDFLTQYNALINEITSLYNADSAKGYEPLTDDEKDQMSDTEIEKWEEKIKASLLRRDDSLESIMNAMTSSMSKGVEINGKTYYLSSFGINTLGYLNAPENQHNAYHINGDEDDEATSGKEDKLMAAIASDPDTVMEFMQGLASNLYDAIDTKMKSTSLSSVYKVYNDKEMASEYSDYTDLIKKWEEKLEAQEDYYYQKFSAMETALAKLNSQTSSLSSMLGG